MNTFKLSMDARKAFKKKLQNKVLAVNGNEEPSAFKVKEEIKQESEMDVEVQPLIYQIKQEDIKMEPTDIILDPDPKHDITSLYSSTTESKQFSTANSIQNKNSRLELSSKNFPPKPKPVYKKHDGRRRKPLINTAINVHRYLSSRNPDSLTQKQIDSLSWAESVILGNVIRRGNRVPVIVEIPDDENNSNELNEVFIQEEPIQIPDSLQLAIVDYAGPGGRYSLLNARLIEKTLSKAVVNYILENPNAKHPIFGKSVYFDGVLVLDCKDEAAYNFAKLILLDIKLWDGSKLKIIEPQKSPFDSIVSLHAPDVGIDKNKVLDILKAQNPSVNMDNWTMLGETSFKTGYKQYSIKISNPPVYFQKHKKLRLYFGGSEVVLKLFGCGWLWNCKV